MSDVGEDDTGEVVAIGSGCSCLPSSSSPEDGRTLHDCHAVIIARRALLKYVPILQDFIDKNVEHYAVKEFRKIAYPLCDVPYFKIIKIRHFSNIIISMICNANLICQETSIVY